MKHSGRHLLWLLAWILLVLPSFCVTTPVLADELRVFQVTRDETTGASERRLRYFDRLELFDGSVMLIDPIWTKEQELSRPLKADSFVSVKARPYDKPDAQGRTGISISRIKSITLWEKMALEIARQLVKGRNFDDAEFLLSKLEEFNAEWEAGSRRGLSQQIRVRRAVDHAQETAKQRPSPEKLERELATLEALRVDAPDSLELAEAFESLAFPLAEKQYAEKKYAESLASLDRVQVMSPKSDKTQKLIERMQKDSTQLIARAEEALQQKRGKAAANFALEALQIRPQDSALRQRVHAVLIVHQVLKVACYEDAAAFDPFNARLLLERQLIPLLFDRLIEPDERGLQFFKGPLVETFQPLPGFRKMANGGHAVEYEFALKPGLTYADGTPITAADVAGTLRGLQDPAAAAHDPELARLLIDVLVKDPFHFSLLARQHPYPESCFTFPIVPEKSTVRLPKRGDPQSRQPVGSGPFVIAANATIDEPLRLEVNSRFRDAARGQPYIRELQFPRYQRKGEGHAEEHLLQRRLHMISDPSPMQLVRLQNNAKEFQTRPMLANSVWVLAINHRRPALSNRDVRRAMLLAIDREAILKQWFAGGTNGAGASLGHSVVTGPFPKHSNANDPAIKVESAQPAAAKRLLSTAISSGQPPTLSLKFPLRDLTIELAVNQIKRDLEDAGFQIHLDPKLPNDLLQEVGEAHDFDLAYWRIDHDNILFNVASLFDPTAKAMEPGGANFSGYAPQKLTQLFVDLRSEQVGDRIWQIQRKIHRQLHDDVVMIPLWQLDSFVVYTNRLAGRSREGQKLDLPVDRATVFRRVEDWFLEPAE